MAGIEKRKHKRRETEKRKKDRRRLRKEKLRREHEEWKKIKIKNYKKLLNYENG